jgi:D-3-phosphoglycerate dehydrogenase / 2-oxoglutarate reductase
LQQPAQPVKISLMNRVLVDSPPFPLDVVRDRLASTGVAVEGRPRPWAGEDVIGLLAWDPVSAADFDRLPALRVVATCSVGFDHIDIAAAARRRVWVCNVPDYCVEEMADSTIALLLALLRGVVVLDRSVRSGSWDDHAAGPLHRLSGARLGIVGFGRIGRAVAHRARALGLQVWATDPLVSASEFEAQGVRAATLDELLTGCAAVTLHLPLTPQTQGLIGERELALMPRGAYLIDTARAQILDWAAFIEALRSGHLAGAAVDVLPVEPPTEEAPAPRFANLIVTPHAAWYSSDSEREVYERAIRSIQDVLEGRVPEDAVVGFGEGPS